MTAEMVRADLSAGLTLVRRAGRGGLCWADLRAATGWARNRSDRIGSALRNSGLVDIRDGRLYGCAPPHDGDLEAIGRAWIQWRVLDGKERARRARRRDDRAAQKIGAR